MGDPLRRRWFASWPVGEAWVVGLRVNRYPGAIGLPHVCSDILRKVSDLDMTMVVCSLL